jgi:hypothetical protein
MSASIVSATGGCPPIGAPHREHTRAVAAASAAHSRHLIWVMMAYGWAAGGCWLDRYELEDLASEVLSIRSPTVSKAHRAVVSLARQERQSAHAAAGMA